MTRKKSQFSSQADLIFQFEKRESEVGELTHTTLPIRLGGDIDVEFFD